jgi:hypothetical protein
VSIKWAQPSYVGGASTVSYKVVLSAKGQPTVTTLETAKAVTVTGLHQAVRYAVSVFAVTKYGTSVATVTKVGVA